MREWSQFHVLVFYLDLAMSTFLAVSYVFLGQLYTSSYFFTNSSNSSCYCYAIKHKIFNLRGQLHTFTCVENNIIAHSQSTYFHECDNVTSPLASFYCVFRKYGTKYISIERLINICYIFQKRSSCILAFKEAASKIRYVCVASHSG